MSGPTAETIVDFLADIFARRGGEEYLGEPVTMAEHMLQAADFAVAAGEPEEVVVAALLHDVGHFTSEFGMFSMEDTEDRFHEAAGGAVLGQFFPQVVVDCVTYHVAAKRYLCATNPAYFDALSEASVHSLNLQGGPMDASEVAEMARTPHLDAILRVRTYDDKGKVADKNVPDFAQYADMVQRVVDSHRSGAGI